MYATVRRYEGVTDPSEAGRRVNEGFVPIISQVPGFVAYYWVDAGGGVMISTSVFQDQASAEESNTRAADYLVAPEKVSGVSKQAGLRVEKLRR